MSTIAIHLAVSGITLKESVGPKPPNPSPTLLRKAVTTCIESYVLRPVQVIRKTDTT